MGLGLEPEGFGPQAPAGAGVLSEEMGREGILPPAFQLAQGADTNVAPDHQLGMHGLGDEAVRGRGLALTPGGRRADAEPALLEGRHDPGRIRQETEPDALDAGLQEVIPASEDPRSRFLAKHEGTGATLGMALLGDGHPGQFQQQPPGWPWRADPGAPFVAAHRGAFEDGPLGGAGLGMLEQLLDRPDHVLGPDAAAIQEAGIGAEVK